MFVKHSGYMLLDFVSSKSGSTKPWRAVPYCESIALFCKTEGTFANTNFKTCQSRSADRHLMTIKHAFVSDMYVTELGISTDDVADICIFPDAELKFRFRSFLVPGCRQIKNGLKRTASLN